MKNRIVDRRSLPRIAIVGPFQPQSLARLLPAEAAQPLVGLKNFAGVPVNWLVTALVEAGIKPTVIGGIRGAGSFFLRSDALDAAIYERRGGLPFVLTGLREERDAILARLREIDPGLVHAHWTFEGGRAVADWNGPKVLTVHDAAWEYCKRGWSWNPISISYGARWLANTAATLARFHHLIAVSPFLENYLRKTHRFRGEIRVIPNAIPELPADMRIPDTFPKSGYVTFACYGEPGRLKNIPSAIRAFRLLAAKEKDVRLIVFGGNWERLRLELLDDHRISFPGALTHEEFLYRLAAEVDVWVHPSHIETHGIVMCEAIQAGCTVIAGRRSGAVPWTLDDGRSGILLDVDNVHELAEGLHSAILDRRGSLARLAYGRQSVRRRFNPKLILDLHLRYYRDIGMSAPGPV